jgi:hypothetical protein
MADLFDVFVVGAADPSPAGVNKIAGLIASRHGAPVEAVTRAIGGGSLRAGRGLTAAAAAQLVQQLNALGAVTDVRPVGAPTAITSAPATMAGARTAVGGFAPQVTGGFGLKPLTAADPFAPPTAADARLPTAIGPGPMVPLNPQPSALAPPQAALPPLALGRDPFAPPGTGAGPSPFAPPPQGARPGAPDPFAPPGAAPLAPTTPTPVDPFADPGGDQEMKLELDRGPRSHARPASNAVAAPAGSLPGASGVNVRLEATSSSSHMHVEEGTGNLASVRCPRHGLYYDKNKASGCRKCLEGARATATAFEAKAAGFRLGGYRDNPAKRAFTGLLFALIVAALPAAFHAFGPGAAEAKRLRVEQEELSRRTGTEEVLRRFDEIDERVVQSRREAIRVTAGIWIVVTAGVMAAWYRIT